ncbi:MAG TPA: PDZ domain-containing protein [Thermoanaerobaculia bacterium]|nr:PDZ domain-containing protein [Thermoanaerobaculia bacterium]
MKRKTTKLVTAALVLAALPALAAPPGLAAAAAEDGQKREVVVLTKVADGEGGPRVLTHVLGAGYLGVELMPLTPELRAHFGLPADRGVMVARVEEDSPAARAGLRVGDVIAGVEGKGVESPWDLTVAVRGKEAGETARLEVWRGGRGLDFDVTIEERERRTIDLGGLQWKGTLDGPHALRLRERPVPDAPPMLFFEPEVMERLGESLEKIDWPRLNQRLGQRNRELETRLEELESRLAELEKALERSRK